jgi:hypothetical protein
MNHAWAQGALENQADLLSNPIRGIVEALFRGLSIAHQPAFPDNHQRGPALGDGPFDSVREGAWVNGFEINKGRTSIKARFQLPVNPHRRVLGIRSPVTDENLLGHAAKE